MTLKKKSHSRLFCNPGNIQQYLIIFLLASSLAAASQPSLPHGGQIAYKQFTVADGLPTSDIYRVEQDSKGFIWFLTDMGLARFDGYEFKTFTVKDGMITNDVFIIHEDSKGRIWLSGYHSALSYYFEDSIYQIELDFDAREIIYRAEDGNANCWFMHREGIMRLSPDGSVTNYPGTMKPFNYAAGTVMMIYENPEQATVWLYAKDEIYTFQDDTISFVAKMPREIPSHDYDYTANINPLNFDYIVKLNYDSIYQIRYNDALVIDKISIGYPEEYLKQLTSHEFNCLVKSIIDEDWRTFYAKYRGTAIFDLLDRQRIGDILVDSEGSYWVSTKNGVFYFYANPDAIRNYELLDSQEDQSISSITADSNSCIYMGLKTGQVICMSPAGVVKEITADPMYEIKFLELDNDHLVVGTNASILFVDQDKLIDGYVVKPKEIAIDYVEADKDISFRAPQGLDLKLVCSMKSLSKDPKAGIWSGSTASICYLRINEKSELNVYRKTIWRNYAVVNDYRNRLWVGRLDGLYLHDADSIYRLGALHQLLSKSIKNLACGSNHLLWVGTDGYGLYAYDYDQHSSTPHLIEELKHAIIKHVFVDERNEVWVSTNQGVMHLTLLSINPFEYTSRKYTAENGIISNEINQVHVRENLVYIATNHGLSIIDQNKHQSDTVQPVVYLKKISVGEEKYASDSIIRLKHNQNEVTFEFGAFAYRSMGNITYQYKMSGIDQDWKTTRNRSITYPNLQPGDYLFSVTATRDNRVASTKAATIQFNIASHWTDRWWFIVIAILTGMLILLVISLWRQKYKRKQEKEKHDIHLQISDLESQALQAQMNPHFIFNSLNSIQYFINSNNNHDANEYLAKFARLIRLNLDMANESHVLLAEEVERLKYYLVLEKLRFGDQINYNIQIEESIDQQHLKIPGMIIQPFVENAIWHGMLPSDRPGELHITIRMKDEKLIITILDNGIGITAANKSKKPGHHSRGVSMIRERLLLLSESAGETDVLRVTELKDYKGDSLGTEVEIVLLPGVYKENDKL